MQLDKQDLYDGKKFIAGRWEPDYVVNAFSSDLRHIPAGEFKSEDDADLTYLKFTFNADNTVLIRNDKNGRTESGTWEQTDLFEYRYNVGMLDSVEDGFFKTAATSLQVQEGFLVFSIGFLAVALKKTEDFDIGLSEAETVAAAPDEGGADIVGRYEVYKAMAMVGETFGTFTRSEVEADIKKRVKSGECDPGEAEEALGVFDAVVEFTPDRKVITWMKIPESASDEDIREAVESGEIGRVENGYFAADEKVYKSAGGKYYYDSGEERELFGEKQSPWDELRTDENGFVSFASMTLRRLE